MGSLPAAVLLSSFQLLSLFVFSTRQFCCEMSHQLSRTQRARAYFRETCPEAPKLATVVGETQDIEYIVFSL